MRAPAPASFLVLSVLTGTLSASPAPPRDPERVPAGQVRPDLHARQRIGDLDPDVRFERLMLVLKTRDPKGLEELLAAQQDPASPLFRRWLTPQAFGERFGAPEVELDALVRWLSEEGFEVEDPPAGRGVVLFSGRAWQLSRTFRTRFGEFLDGSRAVLANEDVPTLPARFADLVAGLSPLDSLGRRQPLYTQNGANYVSPADFARIYNVEPLHAAGIDGRGVTIAVLGASNVNASDVAAFRQLFGLPPSSFRVVSNGVDPGIAGDVQEATLDVEWTGGVAPGASILLVASKDYGLGNQTVYGVDLSAVLAVNQNLGEVISYSYGACEQELNAAENALYANLWAQAAAQGISVLVASGDSGAAGCESARFEQAGRRLAVNGLGSSPYNTSVGGTSFLDRQSPATYWESTHDPTTKRSARSYIPEEVWNESGANGGSGIWSSGGGLSVLHARPPWQNGVPGIAEGTARALPDVALNAAGQHVPYTYVWQNGQLSFSGGTSFAAPAFAGIAALLVQKVGGRLGNLNPSLYALGRAQYTGGAPAVFQDVVSGSNRVPFREGAPQGFDAGEGHDLATGLGSVDAHALAQAWPAPAPATADFFLGARPAAVAVAPGGTAVVTLTLDSPSGAEVVAAVTVGTPPAGITYVLAPTTAQWPPTSGSAGSVVHVSPGVEGTVTLTAATNASPGTYPIVLTAVAGGGRRTLTLSVTVGSAAQAPAGVETQVPIVLDASGAGGSHYTSDLTAVNRGSGDVTMTARYVAVPGTAASDGILLARSLPAGRTFHVTDVLAWLGKNGYRLAADGSAMLGTLYLTFAGATDPLSVYAGSRTSTPNPTRKVGGAFGTFSAAVPAGGASLEEAWVYGLRQTPAFRSNLGLVHAPASSFPTISGPITLEVQVFDGESGAPVGSPVSVILGSGEFQQINNVLTKGSAGLQEGYVRVRRTAGRDRFIAYGVVNDGGAGSSTGTSDGSLITSGGSDGLVPVVLDVPAATRFRTELTLVNPGASEAAVTLTYTPSALLGGSGGGSVTTRLSPGRQLQVSDAIAYLRGLGLPIPEDGTRQGGSVLVSGAIALARTWNPNPDAAVGGTFGVAYPALDASRRARREAWVYGLRRDADVRSNLALADARSGDPNAVAYTVDVFDGGSGGVEPAWSTTVTLAGGQWTQLDNVLAAAGVTHGYARVRAASGTSDFVAYGIVNDGPAPGSRTSDGSYLPMVAGE